MKMYKLDITNEVKKCFLLHGERYNLISLTEKDRYKTTEVLEQLIGDLQNFILTSVLLQGNYGTFKSKDNKQKKAFLCKILNIDHFSNCEKDIIEHYKKLKTQIIVIKRILENFEAGVFELNEQIINLQIQTISISNELKINDEHKIMLEKQIYDSQTQLFKIDPNICIKNVQTLSSQYTI